MYHLSAVVRRRVTEVAGRVDEDVITNVRDCEPQAALKRVMFLIELTAPGVIRRLMGRTHGWMHGCCLLVLT